MKFGFIKEREPYSLRSSRKPERFFSYKTQRVLGEGLREVRLPQPCQRLNQEHHQVHLEKDRPDCIQSNIPVKIG